MKHLKTACEAAVLLAFFAVVIALGSIGELIHESNNTDTYSVADIGWYDCADIRQDHCNN